MMGILPGECRLLKRIHQARDLICFDFLSLYLLGLKILDIAELTLEAICLSGAAKCLYGDTVP
jgi:hypothetical protein